MVGVTWINASFGHQSTAGEQARLTRTIEGERQKKKKRERERNKEESDRKCESERKGTSKKRWLSCRQKHMGNHTEEQMDENRDGETRGKEI